MKIKAAYLQRKKSFLQLIGNWFTRRRFKKYFKTCNLDVVRTLLINKFSGAVIQNELATILDRFVDNPCFKTAFALILFDSKFLSFFELAKKDGITEKLFRDKCQLK